MTTPVAKHPGADLRIMPPRVFVPPEARQLVRCALRELGADEPLIEIWTDRPRDWNNRAIHGFERLDVVLAAQVVQRDREGLFADAWRVLVEADRLLEDAAG